MCVGCFAQRLNRVVLPWVASVPPKSLSGKGEIDTPLLPLGELQCPAAGSAPRRTPGIRGTQDRATEMGRIGVNQPEPTGVSREAVVVPCSCSAWHGSKRFPVVLRRGGWALFFFSCICVCVQMDFRSHGTIPVRVGLKFGKAPRAIRHPALLSGKGFPTGTGMKATLRDSASEDDILMVVLPFLPAEVSMTTFVGNCHLRSGLLATILQAECTDP